MKRNEKPDKAMHNVNTMKKDKDREENLKGTEAWQENDYIVENETVIREDTMAVDKGVMYTTTISEGTKIQGNMEVDGNLQVEGILNGNVECTGHVEITGEITGNINAVSAVFRGASVKGDTICKGDVEILEASNVIGNVCAKGLYANAAIQGDLKIDGDIKLDSKVIVDGNVEAQFLSCERGACIKGAYNIIPAK